MFKWVGLRLIQIKWVMGGFMDMDMDKNCHPQLPLYTSLAPNKTTNLIQFVQLTYFSFDKTEKC